MHIPVALHTSWLCTPATNPFSLWYFAIYKTDNSGVPKIESEDDVYSNSRSISFLKGEDLEAIKNFKYCYDTKDEAIEKLTAFIS